MRLFYTFNWKGIRGEITRRVHLMLLFVLLSSITLFGQAPAGYYDGANGKTGAELKTALYNIIKGHTVISYSGLYSAYTTTDNIVISSNNRVYDMYSIKADGTANYYYSHTSSDQCGTYSKEGDCYNREHSMPQSWFKEASPMVSDLYHVYPTDGYVNNRRSSYPFGKVKTATWTSSNGSKLGSADPATGYTGTVFEPIDEFKGDFARTYFYMATRYENVIANWVGNGTAGQILDGTSYPVFKEWYLNLMIQWHNQDPVSEKEIVRNNAVYTKQNNRNPFIDHPEFVSEIWSGGEQLYFTSSPKTTAVQDTEYSYDITAKGPNGSTLSITYTTIPSWLNFTSTGNGLASLIGRPSAANLGNNQVVLSLTDGTGNYVVQDFTIFVSATLPLGFSSTPVTEVIADNQYQYNITTQGPPNTTYTITCPTKPSWLTFENISNGVAKLSGTPNSSNIGDHDVLLTVSDGSSSKNQEFTINVAENNVIPGGKETFTNIGAASSQYTNVNWTGDDGSTWTSVSARTDKTLNGAAICLKNVTNTYVQSGTLLGGCGSISFKTVQVFTGSGGTLTLYVNDTQIGSPFSYDTTERTASFPSINVSGNFVIKIVNNGSARPIIDDIIWTGYSALNQNSLPIISNTQVSPTNPVTGQSITISSSITDTDGSVVKAILSWGNTSAANSNQMEMTSNQNTYSATIPAQSQIGTLYFKISAIDNSEDTSYYNQSINIAANQLPTISNSSQDPANPTSADNVGVSATVTDPEGRLSTVQLQWGTASNALSNTLSMTNSSSTYSATIPAQTTGTVVYYKIKAKDQEGNFSESTIQNYTVSPSTGIDDNQQNKVTVYPNPFGETLNIKVDGSGSTKVTVMDIIGKVVLTAEFSDKIYPINTSNLKAGIYFVKVLNGDKTNVIRVIKR